MSGAKQSISGKIRVDKLLVDKGYFESRTLARRSILAGRVRIGEDRVIHKSNEKCSPETLFNVASPHSYVSRGAFKLIPALEKYRPELRDDVALDLGASTGGFTDVLLQRGASRVYAVDVGYGQLHYRLRTDLRVICLEKINARYLSPTHIPELIDILTADLSFISITKVLPTADIFLRSNSWIFILIKPQFEAARCEVGKGGVVKSASVIDRIVRNICCFAEKQLAWKCIDAMPSPLKGPKGNTEYVGVFRSGNPQVRPSLSR